MPRYSKTTKTERLRQRLFFQYNKADYTGAARLGEALLRAHDRYHSTDTVAYDDDLYNTAMACGAAGRIDRAVELYTESIHRTFSRSGVGLPVAVKLTNLAALLSMHDQHEASCRIFMQALSIRRQILPHNHGDLADALYNMGNALIRAGRCNDAIPALNSALHIYSKIENGNYSGIGDGSSTECSNFINCLHVIASAYEKIGDFKNAIPYAEAAWRSLAQSDIPEYHRAGYYLAGLYELVYRYNDACKLYLSIMEWVEQTVGCSHSGYINLATKAASQLAKLGDLRQSKDILLRLSKLIEDMVGNNNLTYSNCIRNLAILHQQLEEWDEAENLIKESDSVFKNFPESIPPVI